MPKFRKKPDAPVIIEARQFKTNNEDGPGSPDMDGIVLWMNQGRDFMIAWHNGTSIFVDGYGSATVGDWIVQTPTGVFLIMTKSEFESKFEPAQ